MGFIPTEVNVALENLKRQPLGYPALGYPALGYPALGYPAKLFLKKPQSTSILGGSANSPPVAFCRSIVCAHSGSGLKGASGEKKGRDEAAPQ